MPWVTLQVVRRLMPFTALKLTGQDEAIRGAFYSCASPNAVYGIETVMLRELSWGDGPVVRRLMPFTALKPQPVEFYLDLTDGGMLCAA